MVSRPTRRRPCRRKSCSGRSPTVRCPIHGNTWRHFSGRKSPTSIRSQAHAGSTSRPVNGYRPLRSTADMPSTGEAAIEKLAQGLDGLGRYLTQPQGPGRLLSALGWELPPGMADIGLAGIDLSTIIDKLDGLAAVRASGTDIDIAGAYADLVVAVSNLIAQLRTVATGFDAIPDYLSRTHIATE